MPPRSADARKKLLWKAGVAAALLLAAGLLAARGVDLRALAGRGVVFLRSGGPWLFFTAMAVLPAVGVPLSTFCVTAAPAFADRMGMTGVVAAGQARSAVNLTLARYGLARWRLRPWLVRLVTRLGHRVPQVEEGDMGDLIVLVRVTPGIPFAVQNYLLGLADAPPAKFFAISCLASWPISAAIMHLRRSACSTARGSGYSSRPVALLVALTAGAHLSPAPFSRAGRAFRTRRPILTWKHPPPSSLIFPTGGSRR